MLRIANFRSRVAREAKSQEFGTCKICKNVFWLISPDVLWFSNKISIPGRAVKFPNDGHYSFKTVLSLQCIEFVLIYLCPGH